jgi:hypothetical protein
MPQMGSMEKLIIENIMMTFDDCVIGLELELLCKEFATREKEHLNKLMSALKEPHVIKCVEVNETLHVIILANGSLPMSRC